MRRTHLRGHTNILKRLLIHAGRLQSRARHALNWRENRVIGPCRFALTLVSIGLSSLVLGALE
jgi:hypothetical protein